MPRPLRLALLAAALIAAPRAVSAQDTGVPTTPDSLAGTRLRAQVLAALADAGVASPRGLLLVEGIRPTGELQIRVLEGDLPDAALLRVYQRLHDRPGTWPADTIRALVRVDDDAFTGALAVGAEDGPELVNAGELAGELRRFAAAHPPADTAAPPRSARVETVISRAGAVVFAMVRRSSGDAEADQFAARIAMSMRFSPAHVGAAPVDVWASLPVTVPATQRPGAP